MVYPALTSVWEDHPAMQSASTPSVAAFRRELLENLHDRVGTDLTFATPGEAYTALAYTVRDRLIQRWLDNNLLNTETEDLARAALADLGLSLDELRTLESEPGLGNGGLGHPRWCGRT